MFLKRVLRNLPLVTQLHNGIYSRVPSQEDIHSRVCFPLIRPFNVSASKRIRFVMRCIKVESEIFFDIMHKLYYFFKYKLNLLKILCFRMKMKMFIVFKFLILSSIKKCICVKCKNNN